MPGIVFSDVSKAYSSYARPSDRLRELLLPRRGRSAPGRAAVERVSFELRRGETLCLVGANGSGKTTVLRLAARILRPTAGRVEVRGRVCALLGLGAGFHPELTGHENARLSAALHGLSPGEIRRRLPAIEDFAGIGDYIDRPVRTYSAGMTMRLAFAVAISADPDILLVDEHLAVGDYCFRQRCMQRVHDLRRQGVSILLVSHSMADVQALGTSAIWMDHGRMAARGAPHEVVRTYLARMIARDRATRGREPGPAEDRAQPAGRPEPVDGTLRVDRRFGSGRARVAGVAVLDALGRPARALVPNQRATVRITVRAAESLDAPNVGFMMRNHLGIDFAGTNTSREGLELGPMAAGESRTVDFHLDLPELYAGSFSFAPAVADGGLADYEICDWIDNALTLPMAPGDAEVYGYLHLPCRVEVAGAHLDPGPPAQERP